MRRSLRGVKIHACTRFKNKWRHYTLRKNFRGGKSGPRAPSDGLRCYAVTYHRLSLVACTSDTSVGTASPAIAPGTTRGTSARNE